MHDNLFRKLSMKKLIISSILLAMSSISVAQAADTKIAASPANQTQASIKATELDKLKSLITEKKYDEAFKEAQRVSKKGNPESHVILANMYGLGIGTDKSEKKAFDHFKKAANLGSAEANFELAKIYVSGNTATAKDEVKAKHHLTLASNAKFKPAQVALAQLLLKENKPESTKIAIALLESVSASGEPYSTHVLALVNFNKQLYPQADVQKGVKLLEKNALKGYSPSIFALAEMNHKGIILKKNLKNAEAYYKVVAEKTNNSAAKAALEQVQKELAEAK